jgi:uncharacterized protein YggU (UPF0235/DUF167 family)
MGSLSFVTESKDGVLIGVYVQLRSAPGRNRTSSRQGSQCEGQGASGRQQRERAVEKLLAGVLELPRSGVEVVGGHACRRKRIAVSRRLTRALSIA